MNYNSAKFVASYVKADQLPAPLRPEVCFVGRSNVGKSSIMNKLFKRKDLVKVSQIPGRTQAANYFAVDGVDFVDLPGYGFAKVPVAEKKKWELLIDGYFTQKRRHALCVLLVDIRHDASKLDIDMAQYLIDHEIPFVIAFTKADKLSKAKQAKQMSTLCKQFSFAGDVYVMLCSAVSGQGVDDLRAIINDSVKQEHDAYRSERSGD